MQNVCISAASDFVVRKILHELVFLRFRNIVTTLKII